MEKPLIFDFEPLNEEQLPLLTSWLNQPHLQEWWRDEKVTLDIVREKYMPRILDETDARPFIANLQRTPIGYIQYYNASKGKDWWPDKVGEGVLGIDQFIGDPNLLGKGIGTDMINQFINRLIQDPKITEIRVDPRPDNQRAIACYKKVGFQDMGRIKTPDGDALMMIFSVKENRV